MRSAPGKPPSSRRRFWIDQARSASTGEVGLVDVVAVEAEARLEPQRIARAEADRLHLGLGQQRVARAAGRVRRDRDLEAVLARVAGAGDVAPDAADRAAARAVMNAMAAASGASFASDRLGRRALQGEQRAVLRRGSSSTPAGSRACDDARSRHPCGRR